MPKWINNLFARFTAIYGDHWTKPFVSDEMIYAAKWEWVSDLTLKMMDDEVIDKAIDLCKNKLEWPPTIAKFVEFAKLARDEIEREKERETRNKNSPTGKSRQELKREAYVLLCQSIKKKHPDLSWGAIFEIVEGSGND